MINNRYNIFHLLGEGRSKVYLCHDINYPSIPLAFKVIAPDTDIKETEYFKKEFLLLKKLNHPYILRVDKLGGVYKSIDERISEKSLFITQEFFDGKHIYEYNFTDNEELLKKIIVQLLDVLNYLHQSNYIYYDLKGDNILLNISNDSPEIRLIDFGLTSHYFDEQNEIKGTAKYLAPELFIKKRADYRVDYFSLGVLLYRIIYGEYPFKGENQIDIYRACLSGELIFSQSDFSGEMISVIKRLLSHNPDDRYSNPLQIINDLNISTEAELTSHSKLIPVFAGREDILESIKQRIDNIDDNEVIIISGTEGTGKSLLLEKLSFTFNNAVQLTISNKKEEIWKIFLEKIIASLFIIEKNNHSIFDVTDLLLNNNYSIESILKFISGISVNNKFLLLIDDFDKLNKSDTDFLNTVIPILLVNGSKVAVTTDKSFEAIYTIFPIHYEYELKQMRDEDVDKLLNSNLTNTFPIEKIKNILLNYTDLLPANIFYLLNDLLLLNIIEFKKEGIDIKFENNEIEMLKSSVSNRYTFLYNNLTAEEKIICETISCFRLPVLSTAVKSILINKNNFETITKSLISQNILFNNNFNNEISFISSGFKDFIYSGLKTPIIIHKQIISEIEKKNIPVVLEELAYQYESAQLFEKSYITFMQIIESPDKRNNFSFCKDTLNHVLNFPIGKELRVKASIKLIKILMSIGEYNDIIKIIRNIYNLSPVFQNDAELLMTEGTCLIHLGEFKKGKEILNSLLSKIESKELFRKILIEIASADFDLNLYDDVRLKCNEIINNKLAIDETTAKAYSLLGLCELYEKEDNDLAISYLTKSMDIYYSLNLQLRAAQMEMNIGNIYNIVGDFEKAGYFWENSLKKIKETGSIEQEANLHNNLGINRFELGFYDVTLEHYVKAEKIYKSLGKLKGLGLVLTNLGEVYLSIGDYSSSIISLEKAIAIFKKTNDNVELLESLFLLAYTYIKINSPESAFNLRDEMKKLKTTGNIFEKQSTHIELLELILNYDRYESDKTIKKLYILRSKYSDYGMKYFSARLHYLIISFLIKNGKYIEAKDELNNDWILKIIDKNVIAEAEYYYYMGMISAADKDLTGNSSTYYYQTAFNKIKDESITEITLNILFSLAQIFIERGLLSKAKYYINYTRAVLQHFTDNIRDDTLRTKYVQQKDIKEKFDLLIIWENLLNKDE